MASKWHGKQCPLCNEGTLRDGKIKRQLEYRGRVFESTVKGAFCNHCADGFPDHDEREEAAWLAFRDSVDAEEMAELARIRKKLGLTQQEAARLAGGGKNAFSRYERGQAKPVAAVVNLFRLLDRHPDLLRELRAG
jgi:HTH-type transcriptional regulator / antitoxin MqsA